MNRNHKAVLVQYATPRPKGNVSGNAGLARCGREAKGDES